MSVIPRFPRCSGVCLSLLFLILCGCNTLAGSATGQWVVVTTTALRPALKPLIQQRRAEGFDVVVVETAKVLTPDQLRQRDGSPLQARLELLFRQHKGPHFLLLAGSFDTADNPASIVVPGLGGKVGRMQNVRCDLGYGLPGLDGAPSVSIGRFPARDVDELRAMVKKTLAFEREPQPAPWQNHLLLLLGNPGGGSFAAFAEMFVGQILNKDLAQLHPAWEVKTMFNAASSRYYLPKPQDSEDALRSLEDGQFFSIYLGHSGPEGMGLDTKFITREAWARVNIPRGRGPFFTCGCFACQFTGAKGDGYALTAWRNPTGPVAVIGAQGESYSAPGQLAVEGLLACLAQPPFPSRLGDYWLAVQAGLARGKMDEATFNLLDMADGTSSKVPLATQRLEHLEMWMLLGDPALRLPVVPVDIALHASEPAPGQTLTVAGELPKRLRRAAVRVTLERPLNSKPVGMEKVPPASPDNRQDRLRVYTANFERANAFVLATAEVPSSGTHFTASLTVPDRLPWTNLVLRATATRSHETGQGILQLKARVSAP